MSHRPVVIGLLACEQIIVEERTRNVTPVNCFTTRRVEHFPSAGERFVVFAALTDGLGETTLDVAIQHLEDLDEIYRRSVTLRFADPLQNVWFAFRITACSFPTPGAYQVSLWAGGELIGQNRFHILPKEEEP
jgi:hypothetical protein